jgi:hypothetical protein
MGGRKIGSSCEFVTRIKELKFSNFKLLARLQQNAGNLEAFKEANVDQATEAVGTWDLDTKLVTPFKLY